MKKRTKRILGLLALSAATAGAVGTIFLRRRNRMNKKTEQDSTRPKVSVWARPNMPVTFRAELMPGRNKNERTYRVKELLTSGRVTLQNFSGEHSEQEFEPTR